MKRRNVEICPSGLARGEGSKRRKAACGLALLMFGAMLAASTADAADIVERRGGETIVRGEIVEVNDAGVRIRPENAQSRIVPWDRVRRVETANEVHRERAEEYAELAEDLWRARTRLERDDAAMAEAIFERYFERYRGQTHETALVVAEGALRCSLKRQARLLALRPALEVARLHSAGVDTLSYANLPDVLDEETLLCPALPPVWRGAVGAAGLEEDLAGYDAGDNAVVAALAELYRQSLRSGADVDAGASVIRAGAVQHAGVELLRDIVASATGSREARRTARVRLERQIKMGSLEARGEWAEAWARFFIGASLLEERDESSQKRGLIQLAHVPARFGASQPYLAAEALTSLIDWHEAQGDAEAAASLRAERERRYPNHSAKENRAAGARAWRN